MICMRKLLVGGAAVAFSVGALGTAATAHPVGSADEPTCFGERVSHGSKSEGAGGHGLTPRERRDILVGQIGEDLTVGEVLQFVHTCPAPPPQ